MSRRTKQIELFNKNLGSLIRNLRKSRDMSMRTLSEVVNVSTQQFSKYENGIDTLSAAKLDLIAKALKENISYFYNNSSRANPIEIKSKDSVDYQIFNNISQLKNLQKKHAINNLIKDMIQESMKGFNKNKIYKPEELIDKSH